MARTKREPNLVAIHDSGDGGITVDDHEITGLMVSIVRSPALAHGPRTLNIEVYPYQRGVAAKYTEGYARGDRAFVLSTYTEPYEDTE